MATPAGAFFKTLPGIDKIADSAEHQMEAIRDYVFTLGESVAASSAAPKKKAEAPRKKAVVPARKKAARPVHAF
jgi:hypothetical protein